MIHRVILSPEANDDIEVAFEWHGAQSPGLDDRFLEEVNSALEQVAGHPYRFPERFAGVRAALLRKFRYTIFYEFNETQGVVFVYGILHQARNPKVLKKRTEG